ncbi:MAG TPA: hypothetical protein VHL11_09855 [Phototrophicaceae bacterium]|nr:hypothetical protein [Phototrophicaceae bacterium]
MLDDLRRSASDDFEDEFSGGDDSGFGDDPAEVASGGLFLGMTAVERMFISIFLFLNVCVIGFGLLLATGRIQL